ncbi:MAG: hypothetical protein ACT4R6_12265 [Gemmatimonadaceae bacterium]
MTHTLVPLAFALSVLACTRAQPPQRLQDFPPPALPPISPWPGTLASAVRATDQGNYIEADASLAKFAQDHAGTPEGAEADFWRAIIRLDPFNTQASSRLALVALDSYLNGGPSLPRYAEARVLRRLVEALEASRTQLAASRAAAESRDKQRDDEIRKLSDDLERTMNELDRIRRRLAQKP